MPELASRRTDGAIAPKRETLRGIHRDQKPAIMSGPRAAGTILARAHARPKAGHMDASEPLPSTSPLQVGAVHIWIPVFRCAKTGMTGRGREMGRAHSTRRLRTA